MTVKNLVEQHVSQAYEQLRPKYPEVCGCEICQTDVLVFALNRLPPRYVSGNEGTVVTEINLEKEQWRAQIEVVVIDGIRKIGLAPRHGPIPR
ncbi:MAG TPA: late competence development ComFB family protein [Gemmatimonadales bacterium]|nr:late competence development ComFB family protein [Gemmatimonadales bacterium]